MNTEVKTPTYLPLANHKTEDKYYVNQETDHTVNLGPLMEFFHHWGKDYREGIDIHFQRVLKFMAECMGVISLEQGDWRHVQDQYYDCVWFMHQLKDALYLIEDRESEAERLRTQNKKLLHLLEKSQKFMHDISPVSKSDTEP